MVRVASRHVIVSLPNNWANARRAIHRGRGAVGHYGLPAEPPGDRHKWFFNLSEAVAFLHAQTERYPVKIVDLHVTEKPRPLAVRWLRRLLYPAQERYLNRYARTVWAVYEKNGA